MEAVTVNLWEKFLADHVNYFKHYPFMSHSKDGDLDGNCILYTGTYGVLHDRLFGCYLSAKDHSCKVYLQAYLVDQPGLITRGPHKWEDAQTHDDYIGLASLSYLGAGGAARAIALHGKNNCWSFVRNGKNSWRDWFNSQFWRLPGLVAHLKLCAGMEWSFLDSFLWALGVYANSFSKYGDTSGTILKWHFIRMYEVRGEKHWLCDWAVRKWKDRINSLYPNAMGDVFRIYFGPDHPFAKWALGIT